MKFANRRISPNSFPPKETGLSEKLPRAATESAILKLEHFVSQDAAQRNDICGKETDKQVEGVTGGGGTRYFTLEATNLPSCHPGHLCLPGIKLRLVRGQGTPQD